MSSKLQSDGCYYYTRQYRPLVNATRWRQVCMVCFQVKLCDPHLSALEVRFSRWGAIPLPYSVYALFALRFVRSTRVFCESQLFMCDGFGTSDDHNRKSSDVISGRGGSRDTWRHRWMLLLSSADRVPVAWMTQRNVIFSGDEDEYVNKCHTMIRLYAYCLLFRESIQNVIISQQIVFFSPSLSFRLT